VAHPQSIGRRCNAGNLDFPRRQIDQKQNDKALQSSRGPNFNPEEIGSHNQFPMRSQKLFQGRLPRSLWRWRWLDTVALQNVGNCAPGYLV
jgi:hypothetical protein